MRSRRHVCRFRDSDYGRCWVSQAVPRSCRWGDLALQVEGEVGEQVRLHVRARLVLVIVLQIPPADKYSQTAVELQVRIDNYTT